jgi:hypothetical protein
MAQSLGGKKSLKTKEEARDFLEALFFCRAPCILLFFSLPCMGSRLVVHLAMEVGVTSVDT